MVDLALDVVVSQVGLAKVDLEVLHFAQRVLAHVGSWHFHLHWSLEGSEVGEQGHVDRQRMQIERSDASPSLEIHELACQVVHGWYQLLCQQFVIGDGPHGMYVCWRVNVTTCHGDPPGCVTEHVVNRFQSLWPRL